MLLGDFVCCSCGGGDDVCCQRCSLCGQQRLLLLLMGRWALLVLLHRIFLGCLRSSFCTCHGSTSSSSICKLCCCWLRQCRLL